MKIGVFVLLITVFFGRELMWELRFLSDRTSAEKQTSLHLPPCSGCNLVLLSMDTLRADFAEQSKALKVIAGESVRFTRAYSNAFYTTPSHMTVFTSLYPNKHKVTGSAIHVPRWPRSPENSEALAEKYTTLAEALKTSGYTTHWFGPLNLKHLDLKLGFGRGFDRTSPTLFARPGRPKVQLDTAAWSSALEEKKPFFHFVHSYVTHLPYFLPEDGGGFPLLFSEKPLLDNYYKTSGRPQMLPPSSLLEASMADGLLHDLGQFQLWTMESLFNGRSKKLIPQQQAALKRAYAESVQAFDLQLAEWWRAFKASGRSRDTVVVLFSDHGEELFEHGHGSHSSFYEHTAKVPLLIYHPRMQDAVVYDGLVSLVDILPTVFSILDIPPRDQFQGRNLNGLPKSVSVFGFSLGNDYVFDGRWKLVNGALGQEELYYLPTDPLEKNNLVSYKWPRTRLALNRLRAERKRWILEQAL